MLGTGPTNSEITPLDIDFSRGLMGWSSAAREARRAGFDGVTDGAVKHIVALVGVALRTKSGENRRELLGRLGIRIDGGESVPTGADPLRHDHSQWEVPESTPAGAVTWTVTCTAPGCGAKRQVLKGD